MAENSFGRSVVLSLIGAFLTAAEPPARADKPLRRELAEVARTVQMHLRDRGKSVAVGEFTCAAKPPANYGPGIYLVLCEELTRAGLAIDREAQFIVKGTYKVIVDGSSPAKQLAIKLEVKVERRDGKGGLELDVARAIVDEEMVAGMLGLTVSLPPGGSETGRANELKDTIEKDKKPIVANHRVAARAGSDYGVEVLVKRGGKYEAVVPTLENCAAYAPLRRDDVYALRLYNDSDLEAAASVTIDGLDLFAFSKFKAPALILPPKSHIDVRGWPLGLQGANEFLVTSYAESAAFKLQSFAPVGVINVAFAAAWPVGSRPPADEPRAPTRGSRSSDATGQGKPVGDRYAAVERTVGVLREVISIRYTK